MKKTYTEPEMEIVDFDVQNIITASPTHEVDAGEEP